jgi:outer membrane immunogenic protein
MRRYVIAFCAASTFNIASMAQAADMPRAAPARVYKALPGEPVPFWTGFYAGLQGGYGWGTSSGTQSSGGGGIVPEVPYAISPHGLIGGGHAGYNYRFGNYLAGIEGDIEAAHIDGFSAVDGFGATRFYNVTADTLGSVRGRLGWISGNWMLYGTGGVAFGHVVSPPLSQLDGWRTGWTAGAGVERALSGQWANWSTRLEYRYTDLGRQSGTDPVFGTTDDNTLAFHAVRLGISYRFGGPK